VRVLVVDQDPLVCCVVRDALARGRGSVAEAADGREAVDLAERHKPDVVPTDIMRPELEGPIAIRPIVSASPLMRVVVLAAAKNVHMSKSSTPRSQPASPRSVAARSRGERDHPGARGRPRRSACHQSGSPRESSGA
jgi:CheY-like chemotaxis protein